MGYHEKYYLAALKHFESEKRSEALWAKALTLAEGNEEVAKYKYIALFVERVSAKPESTSDVTGLGRSVDEGSNEEEHAETPDPVAGPARLYDPRLHRPSGPEEPVDLRSKSQSAEQAARLSSVEPSNGSASSKPKETSSAQGDFQSVEADISNARLVYYLYLIGFFVLGISAVVGLVMAYVNNDSTTPAWVKSHYKMQTALFWWTLGILLAIALLIVVVAPLGVIVLVAYLVWLIVALVKGLKALQRGETAPYFQ